MLVLPLKNAGKQEDFKFILEMGFCHGRTETSLTVSMATITIFTDF
jgi:hypothetical protein